MAFATLAQSLYPRGNSDFIKPTTVAHCVVNLGNSDDSSPNFNLILQWILCLSFQIRTTKYVETVQANFTVLRSIRFSPQNFYHFHNPGEILLHITSLKSYDPYKVTHMFLGKRNTALAPFANRDTYLYVKNAFWIYNAVATHCLVRHQWKKLPHHLGWEDTQLLYTRTQKDFELEIIHFVFAYGVTPQGFLHKEMSRSIFRSLKVRNAKFMLQEYLVDYLNATYKFSSRQVENDEDEDDDEPTEELISAENHGGVVNYLRRQDQAIVDEILVSPSSEFWKDLDIPAFHVMVHVTFVTAAPQPLPQTGSLLFLVRTEDGGKIWIIWGIAFLLAYLVARHSTRDTPHYAGGLRLFSALFDQPLVDRVKNCSPEKIIIWSWYITVFFFGMYYKSSMESNLVAPTFVKPPSTFQDLFAQPEYKVLLTGMFKDEGSGVREEFKKRWNATNVVWESLNFLDVSKTIKKVLKGKVACISSDILIRIGRNYALVERDGKYQSSLATDNILPSPFGTPISPYGNIKEYASTLKHRFWDTGISSHVYITYEYFFLLKGQLKKRSELVEENEVKNDDSSLSLNKVLAAFLLVPIGSGLAVLAFHLELLVRSFPTRKRRRKVRNLGRGRCQGSAPSRASQTEASKCSVEDYEMKETSKSMKPT